MTYRKPGRSSLVAGNPLRAVFVVLLEAGVPREQQDHRDAADRPDDDEGDGHAAFGVTVSSGAMTLNDGRVSGETWPRYQPASTAVMAEIAKPVCSVVRQKP